MLEVAQERSIWDWIGSIGGAMVTAAAGYAMTRFEPRDSLSWEKYMSLPVKAVGYALIGYAAYDAMRDWLEKGNG